MKVKVYIAFIFLTVCMYAGSEALFEGQNKEKCLEVSMIQLLANPSHYHGKRVRVVGVASLDFEANHLFLSKEHLKYSVQKNALWINMDFNALKKSENEAEEYNGKYVLIEGTFNKDETGHMEMNSGGIDKITRYDLWENTTGKGVTH